MKNQQEHQRHRRGLVGVEWLVLFTALASAGIWMARSHAAATMSRQPTRTLISVEAQHDAAAAGAAAPSAARRQPPVFSSP